MLNADVDVYTWKTNRLWRKTRSPNEGTTCVGTDGNRNFEYKWGGSGSSPDPCSNEYHGSAPFSEIETKSVASFLSNIPDLIAYINFHSYSQFWMHAWGYTTELPLDNEAMSAVAEASVTALTAVHGTEYVYGPLGYTLYLCAGNAVDWMYGSLGIKYSYLVELRDTGEYGFLLPEDQIIPSGEETFVGFKTFALTVLEAVRGRSN